MSFFSSKPKNRRRRVRRTKKTESTWSIDYPSAPPRRRKKARKEDDVHVLHAKIGALESFLAKQQEAEDRRMQMKAANILPPPDRTRHRRPVNSMTLAERRRYLAERSRNGMQFLILFCLACAIGWWLLFSSF